MTRMDADATIHSFVHQVAPEMSSPATVSQSDDDHQIHGLLCKSVYGSVAVAMRNACHQNILLDQNLKSRPLCDVVRGSGFGCSRSSPAGRILVFRCCQISDLV